MANKVQFGLCDVVISKITVGNDGSFTYGTPFAIPGAVNLSLDPAGDEADFAADNNAKYFVDWANNGYTGTLEMALIGDKFREDILGQYKDVNGAILENASDSISPFALGFRIDGDSKNTKFWYYNCIASRPSQTGATTDTSRTPQTETLNITAMQRPSDGAVRVYMTESSSNTAAYASFFTNVYEKTLSV